MKRIIIILLFVLCASGLFAKDKVLFQKKTEYSFLDLYESKNPKENNGFKYYVTVNEDDMEGGWLLYMAVSNDYKKIQDFTTNMYKSGNQIKMFAFYFDYYATLYDDLVLDYEETKIDSKNNQIVEYKVYILK